MNVLGIKPGRKKILTRRFCGLSGLGDGKEKEIRKFLATRHRDEVLELLLKKKLVVKE